MLSWTSAPLTRADVERAAPGRWRYSAALPPLPAGRRLHLGGGVTPLHRPSPRWPGLKLDHLQPTGSYKERGAEVLVAHLAAEAPGASVYDDSSGNAGVALAACARVAGLRATVLAPATATPGKLAVVEAYGGRVELVDGDRAEVARVAAERGRAVAADPAGAGAPDRPVWASHVHHPLYPAGCATVAYELWEQRGFELPATVVVACGYGSQVAGLLDGLAALRGGGATGPCRVVAVNTTAFPALQEAWAAGDRDTTAAVRGTTVADGITCANPVRGRQLLAGLRATGGTVLAVGEGEISAALLELADVGLLVEPTAAVALAGWRRLAAGDGPGEPPDPGSAAVVLSGSGLLALPILGTLLAGARSR